MQNVLVNIYRLAKMALVIKARVSENDRHLKDVATLLFHEGKLFSGAEDGIVKMWDPNLRLLSEFQAHEVNVYHLAAIGNTLYTCSNDGTIKAWFIDKNFTPKKTLLKYDDEVYRLIPDGGKLYCGDNKGMIGIFENDECLLIYNFIEEVSDLIVQGNLIYTVRDRDLVITELSGSNGRYMTRKTLEGSNPMCIVGSKLCCAARSGVDILVHDNSKDSTFKELARLDKSHDMIINALCSGSDGLSLYSGGWDKKVKRWDLQGYTCTGACDVGVCVCVLCAGPTGIYVAGTDGFMCQLAVE